MMKRALLIALSWLMTIFPAAPALAAPLPLEAGKHYTEINPPLSPQTQGKIEVVEFFSYGCPHCADFHPVIGEWAAKLPKDIGFRRVPVTFARPPWERLAKIYYALETTGNLARLDHEVFKAIHQQRINFATDEAVGQWVATKGVDLKKFGDAMNGFSTQSLIRRGDQDATAARIPGVPAIIVDGRYLVNNSSADNYDKLLQITDAIVDKARNEKRKR